MEDMSQRVLVKVRDGHAVYQTLQEYGDEFSFVERHIFGAWDCFPHLMYIQEHNLLTVVIDRGERDGMQRSERSKEEDTTAGGGRRE
jgi:hypothetical protein